MTPQSRAIRQNVFYSVLDYASQPAMMLIAAPFLLRALGPPEYGTWMLVNSIAATASGLGGGFGDGAIRYVSMYRGRVDRAGAVRCMIAVLLVNCTLGLLSAALLAVLAPWLIGSAFVVEPSLRRTGIVALQISSALLVVRFAETVFTSALRGYERYRPMVTLSVLARTAVIAISVVLALKGYGLVAIMWATLAIGCASLASQAWLAFRIVDLGGLWKRAEIRGSVREVFSFSAFTWLKSTLGVMVGYADRLLVGALLGTGPLAFYALCNQLTQTVPALIASAFNFVFPNFSVQSAAGRWSQTERSYRIAAATAALVAFGICLNLILLAKPILRIWLGASAAAQYQHLLITMAIGNGLLAISVVPHYAALALGRSRALVVVTLIAGIASLTSVYVLVARMGLIGAAFAKIVAGAVFLFSFNIVRRAFQQHQRMPQATDAAGSPVNALTVAQ
jgi:O-antigen/teichoic acid export membrane protein